LSFRVADRILQPAENLSGTSQAPRRFLDIYIDGKSLYSWKASEFDFITGVWVGREHIASGELYLHRLMRTAPPDFMDGRNSLYICPECGDLGCGAVSALIRRDNDAIVWEAFGYQNDYDETVQFSGFETLGPFRFKIEEYQSTLDKTLELVHAERLR